MDAKDELRKKLQAEIDVAEWAWIKPHLEHDRVIIVSQDLELLDVAVQIAVNELQQVESWMTQQLLTKPTREQIHAFDADDRRLFQCVVVQPWVLIQIRGC